MSTDLIASIEQRIRSFLDHRDPTGILDEQAVQQAAALVKMPEGRRLNAMLVVATLHYYRYLMLPDGEDLDDLGKAVIMFHNLAVAAAHADDDPPASLVPPSIARLFAESPSTDDPAFAHAAGVAVLQRYEASGSAHTLDLAITILRTAVPAAPRDTKARVAFDLVKALFARFDLRQTMDDLEEATTACAVASAIEEAHLRLYVLYTMLDRVNTAFHQFGGLPLLRRAVELADSVLPMIPAGTRNRFLIQLLMSDSLIRVGEFTGRPADFDRAVSYGRDAVDACPLDHEDAPVVWSNLGNALRSRFERTGRLADLDEAAEHSRWAVEHTPDGNENIAVHNNNLANVLRTRYEVTEQLLDLNEAVEAARSAVLNAGNHPFQGMFLANLSIVLRLRFGRSSDSSDLDAAIEAGRLGVQRTPPEQPDRARYLSTLSSALLRRFRISGLPEDLAESIDEGRQALDRLPAGHTYAGMLLNILGTALLHQVDADDGADRLDEAIGVLRQAVSVTAQDHASAVLSLSNLASALEIRHRRGGPGSDVTAAIDAWRTAANLPAAPARHRVDAAHSYGRAAQRSGDHGTALTGFETSVGLLPVLAWHGLDRHTREHHLATSSGLASTAAAAALTCGRPERAVELLELGRSVLWTSRLRLRGDLSTLAEAAPGLAARMDEIRTVLDRDITSDARPSEGEQHRRLAREWDELLDQVRTIPGFTRFLAPTPFEELVTVAADGPIVIVNAADERCDAIIITVTGSRPAANTVPLPDLTLTDAVERAEALLSALAESTSATATFLDRERARHLTHDTLEWLWDSIVEPVLAALGPVHRVWWSPTGPLAMLPLHAAGHYPRTATATGGPSLLDRVVSSYAPTLTALRRRPDDDGHRSMLAVGVPENQAGDPPLAAVEPELAAVREHVPDGYRALTRDQATRAAVLARLPDSAWTHLACHAIQNPVEPARSALRLWDGEIAAADIAGLRLDHPQLAFLSACQTASGAPRLADEAIHLAAAMNTAGYRHVVATLWSIHDQHTPDLAGDFYRGLTGANGAPSAAPAGAALHHAVNRLRAALPTDPTRWAPYVHIGP